MPNLTVEDLDKDILSALDDYEKAQKAKGGARGALTAFTEKLKQRPRMNLPKLGRRQSDTTR